MHTFRTSKKLLQSFKRFGIKLHDTLHTQGTNCLYMLTVKLFHEWCSLDKWLCSLGKWYRQAAHTHFTCDFLVVFERAVDLRMEIALHTFVSIKDVCLHRTPFSHLLITRKKIPFVENTICQNGQVKVTKIIAANIIFHTYFAVST